jgi:hypothetical protein|tara:strand:+ start:265 stop:429 length:165 start_codon:yes stop_codon:yes gene_type:complete
MSQDSNKFKEWDGLTWVVLPLIYLEEFVKLIASKLLDAYTKWDYQRFNDSLPKE